MLNKIKFICHKILLPIVFWIAVWEIGAAVINNSFFLPTVSETLSALVKIISSDDFLIISAFTLIRVLAGLFIGTIFGCIFALAAHRFGIVHSILSPFVSVVKATPVASIIILLWISPLNGNQLAIFISLLMVFPIIWQNLYDGFSSIDKELDELASSYEFSYKKRLKILVIPTLKKYFIPAFITAMGLAFKSEIAAEIITGVRNSIGQMIYYSKDAYDTASVFAWTVVGIVLSILLENITKILLKKKRIGGIDVTHD